MTGAAGVGTPPAGRPTRVEDVVVIGGGASGLAVGAELRRRGVGALVLDRGDAVGQVWRERYARLHLHTVRQHSGLPGLPIPRTAGRFVPAAEFARYLGCYADRRGVPVRLHAEVVGVRATDAGGARWLVRLSSGERIAARCVVVATGRASRPETPPWPGTERYTGRLLRASEYREGSPFAGARMLVVGAGNSGAEIAVDLVESGAASVDLAIRTPPNIVRRELGPFWSAQQTGILVSRLPSFLLDALGRAQALLTVPDLAPYGLPRPSIGIGARLRDGVVPLQDVGLIAAVRSRRVRVRPAVTELTASGAAFADGSEAPYDAVIAALGYRPGLEPLVPADLLDAEGLPVAAGGRPAAPGLFFVGYTVSLRGAIRDAGGDARRAARRIAASLGR